MQLLYKIIQKYQRDDVLIAYFIDKKNAEIFIMARLAEDDKLKLNLKYGLYEGIDLIKEYSQADLTGNSTAGGIAKSVFSQASSSGGAQRSSTFQPTPFNSAPRPAGMPQNWGNKSSDDYKEK